MFYDVDQDILYVACLERHELWLLFGLVILVWELIKLVIRTEFFWRKK